MKKALLPILILLLALAGMSTLVATRPVPEKKPRKPKPVLVETLAAESADHRVWLESQGAITPVRQTSLIARVNGTVIETAANFVRGGFFHQGDVLLRLDPTDHEVALTRAEAALASRKAQLAAELARAEQARKDWEAGGKGKASPLVLRKPYVDEARAAVKAAEADLAQARANLERTFIRAPYDGVVLEKNADLGQFINIGGLLGRIAATGTAEVRLPLTEAELAMLPVENDQPQENILVDLEIRQGDLNLKRQAQLVRTEAVADDKTRTVYAVVQILDPYLRQTDSAGDLMRFGGFVHARLPGRVFPNSFELPRHVLDARGQIRVSDHEAKLHIRPAHVIAEYAGKVLIDRGIEAGEQVVLTPIPNAVEGMQLRISGGEPETSEPATKQASEQAQGEQ